MNLNSKQAAVRIVRTGLKTASTGDLDVAVCLIKTGLALAEGCKSDDVLNLVFDTQSVKTAEAIITDAASTPSVPTPKIDIQKVVRFLQNNPDLVGAAAGTVAGGALGYQRGGLAGAGIGAAAGGGGGYLLGSKLKPKN
jgi:uncharacterized protein YcfJ